jgi:hypothetical protein
VDKLKIAGFTGVDLSVSDADGPPNKLLHAQNFILSQKYGNPRRRAGSISYPIEGDIYGIGGYAKSNISMLNPLSITPVRYRYESSTPYFEKFNWDLEADEVNYYTYSQDVTNAAWNKQNVTTAANSAVAPDGTTTADTITASAGSSAKYFYPTTSPAGLTTGKYERHSVYLKKNTNSYAAVSNAYGDAVIVNLDTGASVLGIAAGGFSDHSVEGAGNGWYRITIEFLKTSSATRQIYVSLRSSMATVSGVSSITGAAGTESIYVWGMQANNRDHSETYVATTAAAVSTLAWTPITIHSDVSSLLAVAGIVETPQVSDVMGVFAGTPAMIDDISTGELSRLGGPVPTVAPTVSASGSAGALTGTFYCCYTYYDPTSGWESSPSPISSLVTVAAEKILWILDSLPAPAKKGVTKLRLYRTESSGEQVFYRVMEYTIGDAPFTEEVTLLGAQAPDIGEHDPPPTGAYLGESYANRFWTTDGGTSVRFSKAFDGDPLNLQYFPDTNEISFNQKVTALKASERLGGLLVFKPPGFGIDLIRGTSEDDFEVVSLYPELGTNYSSSVTIRAEDLLFWGEGRPILLRNGNVVPYYSKTLDDQLKDLGLDEYNGGSYVWSFYHPQYQQVFWGVSALSDSGSAWEELGSGLFASWEVKSSGLPASWSE